MPDTPVRELSDDTVPGAADAARMRGRLAELAAHIHAAQAEMVELLGRLDACDGWQDTGIRSIGHWASIELGLDARATARQVSAARRLRALPAVAAAARAGELGWPKVSLLTQVAEPSSEADWLALAREMSVGQLRRTTKAYRRARRQTDDSGGDPGEDPGRRRGVWLFDEPDGLVRISALLEADDAAVLRAALNAQLERTWRADHDRNRTADDGDTAADSHNRVDDPARRDEVDPARQARDPIGVRRAEALIDLLRASLADPDRPDPVDDSTQVIVHVDLDFLTGDSTVGRCHTNHGDPLPREAARRAACDALIRPLLHDGEGRTLDLGRSARTPSRALRRALAGRDNNCCTFPGCTTTIGLAAHHVRHWTDDGPTDLDNLALLCRHHHKLHHEGGYRMSMVDGRPRFFRPDGRPITPPGPPPPDLRRGFPALRDQHDEAGLTIDRTTPLARSGGATDWSLSLTLDALFSVR